MKYRAKSVSAPGPFRPPIATTKDTAEDGNDANMLDISKGERYKVIKIL